MVSLIKSLVEIARFLNKWHKIGWATILGLEGLPNEFKVLRAVFLPMSHAKKVVLNRVKHRFEGIS